MGSHEESFSAEDLLAEAGFLGRLARGLVGDEHDAADLAQETMLAALGRPPRPVGSLRGWLATVAANLARNARRGEGARARREQAAARPERLETEPELARLEIQRALFDLVVALPEEQRTVLYLRYYAELGPADIAARLGVPLRTVKSRHTRALAALRERLDARSGGDRRKWLEALAPLAIPRSAAGGAVQSAIGGLAVKKLVLAGVALVLALIGWRTIAHGWLRERWEASRRHVEQVAVRPPETKPAGLAPALTPHVLQERRPLVEAAVATTGALALTFRHPDGTPAGDLPFAIECRNDPAPRVETFRARTAGDGTASIYGLFAGPVRIWLDTGRLDAEVEAGKTRAYEFTFAGGITIEGTVVDLDGAPIADAEIWCGRSSARFPGGVLRGTSGQDGSFRLRDVGEDSWVGARKRGYLPSQCWRPWELTAIASGVRTVRLELGARGGSVRGRVVDPDGKPVARAEVLAGPDGGWTSGAKPGTAPEPAFAETDELGEFELRNDLPPGKHPIHATARGFPIWRGEVEVAEGQTTTIEIHLERPARIEGRLLGLDGAPAGGVEVLASAEDRGGWYHDRFGPSEGTTDDQGWFALDWVAPGLRELNAYDDRRPELGRARASVPCAAGETATCELRLELGLTIAGTVVDESGAPLAGWGVQSEAPLMRQWYPRRARTDEQGRFQLANLGEGSHDLIVRPPEGNELTRTRLDGVPAGTRDAVIVVRDAHVAKGTLRGRLVAPPGERTESFILTLALEGGDEGLFLEPDAGGDFEMQVAPGRYQVRVAGHDQDLLVSAMFAVESDGVTDVGELRVEEPGRVEIELPDLSRRDLERLRLSLDHEGCSTVNMELEDGVLRSPEIMPGRWRVSMNASDLCLRPPEVEVRAGTTTRVELRVEPTVRVRLVIQDPARDEVEVEALDPAGTRFFHRTYLATAETPTERTVSIGLPTGHATVRLRTHAGLKGEVALDVTPELAGAPPIAVELR